MNDSDSYAKGVVGMDLDILAQSGSTVLIGAMASDAWQMAKSGFARLLGRSNAAEIEVLEGRLSRMQAKIEALEGEEREKEMAAQQIKWRGAFEDYLAEHEEAATEFDAFLQSLKQRHPDVGMREQGFQINTGDITAYTGGVSAAFIKGDVSTRTRDDAVTQRPPGPSGPPAQTHSANPDTP